MTRVLSLEDQHRNSLRNVQRTDLPFPKASFCLWAEFPAEIHWNLEIFLFSYRNLVLPKQYKKVEPLGYFLVLQLKVEV
jgi:hypothetical protein